MPVKAIDYFLTFSDIAHLMRKPGRKVNAPLFIFFEYFLGLAFGVVGSVIYSYSDTTSKLLDFTMKIYLVGMLSILFGVLLVGFFHYKAMQRLRDFGNGIAAAIAGFFIGTILLLFLNAILPDSVPEFIYSYIFAMVLPLTGAVTGINLAILNKKDPQRGHN